MNALIIAIPVLVLLAGILLLGAARRRDTGEAIGTLSRETRKRDRSAAAVPEERAQPDQREVERSAELVWRQPPADVELAADRAPVPWTPPEPEALAVTRRQFLNRSVIGVSTFGLSAFGVSIIGMLWPAGSGGFGGKIAIGTLDDIRTAIGEGNGFAYYPEARTWVTEYPSAAIDKARQAYSAPELVAMEAGFVPLYQKCVHLGCRVPECETSQWFECPCHGSQYNRVGEKKGGPAPRGLDRFPVTIDGDRITVDTNPGTIILGPPIGTNTTGQEAEGPHCIGGGGEH
ncbi:MAG: ubiquinol-cytochrome c reductase iron-sulfur subunit [Acidimicrobiales bacterium]